MKITRRRLLKVLGLAAATPALPTAPAPSVPDERILIQAGDLPVNITRITGDVIRTGAISARIPEPSVPDFIREDRTPENLKVKINGVDYWISISTGDKEVRQ